VSQKRRDKMGRLSNIPKTYIKQQDVEREYTRMSRVRFEELHQGILDGSLAERMNELITVKPADLVKKQKVEMRQVNCILSIADEDMLFLKCLIDDKGWRRVRFLILKDGRIGTVVE
jgi:hypothetical protein